MSEEELRESISYTLDDLVNIEQSARFHNTDWAEYTIEKLVTQYSLTKQLEARADELESRLRAQFIPSHWERLRNETNSWAKYVDRRISEIKHQLQKEQQ